MSKSDTITALAAALAKAQAEIRPAAKDSTNPHFKSRYADLAAIWEACRKPLTSNGLSVVQMPIDSEPGHAGLMTMLIHESGEYISASFSVKTMQDTAQGVGSALTYLRRYALASFVGVVADEDDDGNAASRPQAQRQEPRQQERKPAPRAEYIPAPDTTPDPEIADAETKFYAAIETMANDAMSWPEVQTWLGSKTPKPTSVEGWREAYKLIRTTFQQRQQAEQPRAA